jgi:SAM-dependent methyltransferase
MIDGQWTIDDRESWPVRIGARPSSTVIDRRPSSIVHRPSGSEWVCPACRTSLNEGSCDCCGRNFPIVAGLPDLRVSSDRFLDLAGERAKAERLARLAPDLDLKGLAEAYYTMTPDVEPRRRGFYLRHILEAEFRGSALATMLPRRGKILEIGCGTGGLLAAATRMGLEIEGVDIALRWLVVARRRLDDLGLSCPLLAASAERLPYADASFNAVVADSVLEHLDDPRQALDEWARVLRPGGTLLVWSPNRYAMTVDPHVRLWGLGWLPRAWMPAYVRWRRGGAWPPPCLSGGEVRRMAWEAGFDAIELEPPGIPENWARSRSAAQQRLITAYSLARRLRASRTMLRALGPLWQLRATRRGLA